MSLVEVHAKLDLLLGEVKQLRIEFNTVKTKVIELEQKQEENKSKILDCVKVELSEEDRIQRMNNVVISELRRRRIRRRRGQSSRRFSM